MQTAFLSVTFFRANSALAVTEDQREALLDLLLSHGHSAIGPEVRRELLAGRGRGVPIEQDGPAFDGDDTMHIDP